MAPSDDQRRTLRTKAVIPPIARAIGSRLFKLIAVVWALQVPMMVAIVWIAEGPPTMASDDSWWNAEIFRWWYTGMLSLALIWPLSGVVGMVFGKRNRRRPEEWRAMKVAQIEARLREQRMSKFSLENLRDYDYPEFNVKQLFLLHQRSEVLARCKVQVHRDHYDVILVIAGEYVRITRCNTEREVWSIAAAWKAELLAQRWHPVDPPAKTFWRSRHGEWKLSVFGPGDCRGSALRESPPFLIGTQSDAPTVALAQMEILRQLVEETGHICSDRCTPWTFELQIQDSDMPS